MLELVLDLDIVLLFTARAEKETNRVGGSDGVHNAHRIRTAMLSVVGECVSRFSGLGLGGFMQVVNFSVGS